MLSVFIHRRRADHLDLPAGKHGLHDIGRVQGALGASRSDDRMQLIDEQKHLVRSRCLAEHIFDPLLKIPAESGACDHRGHVQRDDPLLQQGLRRGAVDDLLRQPFHDRGLADAGLPDQAGIVLGPAAENLTDAVCLRAASDDRIQLPVHHLLRHIPGVLVQSRGIALIGTARRLHGNLQVLLQLLVRNADDIQNLCVHRLEVHVLGMQKLRRVAVDVAHQSQQNVLGSDLFGVEPGCLIPGGLQHEVRARRQVSRQRKCAFLLFLLRVRRFLLPLFPGRRFRMPDKVSLRRDQLADQIPEDILLHTRFAQHHAGGSAFFHAQSQQQMLGPDHGTPGFLRALRRVPYGILCGSCIRIGLFHVSLLFRVVLSSA